MSLLRNVLWSSVILFLCVGLVSCATTPTLTPVSPTPTLAPTPTTSAEVILTTGDWPPYVFEQGDPGPMAALITAAFKESGVTTKIVFYPWKRAEDEVRQGKAFAAFPYAITAERQKEFDFSDPIYVAYSKFFYSKKYHPNGIPFAELKDLRGYIVGGVLGYWYEPTFKDAGLQVESVASTEQNIEKLALGRIDLMIEEENTTWYLVRKLRATEIDQFAALPLPASMGSAPGNGLMVSRSYPNSAQLLKQFNTGLATLRANGAYKQILEKYQIVTEGQ